VYELIDLGYGRCRMVLASVEGEDRAQAALRRLGVMRIATSYPRIAGQHPVTEEIVVPTARLIVKPLPHRSRGEAIDGLPEHLGAV
jgi:ATP phosphoribosyltransferase